MKLLVALTILVALDCCYCTPYKRRVQATTAVPPKKEENKATGQMNADKTYSVGAGFDIKRKQGVNIGPRNNLFHVGYETQTKVEAHAHAGTRTAVPKPNNTPAAPVKQVETKTSKAGRGCFSGKLFCSVKVSDVRTPRPVSGHSEPPKSNTYQSVNSKGTFNSNSFHSAASSRVSDAMTPEHSISNSNSFYSASSRRGSDAKTPVHSISNSNSFYSANS